MTLFRIGILALSLFGTISLTAQALVFDAYLSGDHIGKMTVTRKATPDGYVYTNVTDLTVTYVFSIDLDFAYSAHYVGDQLTKTSFSYQRNHKTKENVRGSIDGSSFATRFDDRTERVDLAAVQQSLTAAYFAEPTHLDQVFSERWGVNIDLESLGNRRYKITLPDGKESIMTYANGQCRESRIVSGWGDIVFKR